MPDRFRDLNHELWTWLAENPSQRKGDWPGWQDRPNRPYGMCFACEATVQYSGSLDCNRCPISWNPDRVTGRCACENDPRSPYAEWDRASELYRRDFPELTQSERDELTTIIETSARAIADALWTNPCDHDDEL